MKQSLSPAATAGIVAVVVVLVGAVGYFAFLRPSDDAAPPITTPKVLPGQPGYPATQADHGAASLTHRLLPGQAGYPAAGQQ